MSIKENLQRFFLLLFEGSFWDTMFVSMVSGKKQTVDSGKGRACRIRQHRLCLQRQAARSSAGITKGEWE